jgi:beta-phosphoglucomutase-like phosphatase (HAD superfamily)
MNLLAAFDVIITADQVQQSKPAPESYVKTMHHLQQLFPAMENQAGWSLAIEDTPTGIQSARGAGLSVLAVANSYPPAQLTDADWTIQTLAGLTLQKLQDKAFREI